MSESKIEKVYNYLSYIVKGIIENLNINADKVNDVEKISVEFDSKNLTGFSQKFCVYDSISVLKMDYGYEINEAVELIVKSRLKKAFDVNLEKINEMSVKPDSFDDFYENRDKYVEVYDLILDDFQELNSELLLELQVDVIVVEVAHKSFKVKVVSHVVLHNELGDDISYTKSVDIQEQKFNDCISAVDSYINSDNLFSK